MSSMGDVGNIFSLGGEVLEPVWVLLLLLLLLLFICWLRRLVCCSRRDWILLLPSALGMQVKTQTHFLLPQLVKLELNKYGMMNKTLIDRAGYHSKNFNTMAFFNTQKFWSNSVGAIKVSKFGTQSYLQMTSSRNNSKQSLIFAVASQPTWSF